MSLELLYRRAVNESAFVVSARVFREGWSWRGIFRVRVIQTAD